MTRMRNVIVRLAIAIHRRLTIDHTAAATVELPALAWQQCETLQRRMCRARQRGWHLAAERLRRELREMLQRLHGDLAATDALLEPRRSKTNFASIGDTCADLVALHEEFDEVVFNLRRKTISVTTEPIELEGVYLGPFEIRLDWSDLAAGHPHNYRVTAVDANPAAANESVTHPHVQDETVCEGEGRGPIRKSLQQGRLLDFFVIVANLLRNYNSDSPYVSLPDWNGVACADCGTTVCDDEKWTCEKCESSVCGDCYFNCPGCDRLFCNECVTRCQSCDEVHCSGCMSHCSQCRTELCQGCLHDDERCSDCHENECEKSRDDALALS